MSISIFEGLMLLCFGVSWPISIFKAVKTKKVAGKSPIFMSIVIIGYGFGIIHKLLYSFNYIIFLYIFNMVMIIIDIILYFKYLPAERHDPTKVPQAGTDVNSKAGRSDAP